MKALIILNDPPYGTERSFNGLRLAKALAQKGCSLGMAGGAVTCPVCLRP